MQYRVEMNGSVVGCECCTHTMTFNEATEVGDKWYGALKWREYGTWLNWLFGRRWRGYSDDGRCFAKITEEDVEWTGPYYE